MFFIFTECLMTRYSAEYDMSEIPWLVKKLVLPVTYFIGKLLGKYSHFKNAPEPVKAGASSQISMSSSHR